MKKYVNNFIVIVSALLFAVCAMLTPVLKQGASATMSFRLFILAFWGFVVAYFGFIKLSDSIAINNTVKFSDRRLFGIMFSMITIVGVFYLLVYYPGTGMYDTLAILQSGISIAKQHPWFYCLIIQSIVSIVFAFGGDYEAALVLCSVIQIIVTATVYASIIVWLKNKGTHKIALSIIALFYIFYPLLGLYMVTLFKDIPYSLVLTAWVPLLYEYYESNGMCMKQPRYLIMFVFLIISSLLRNNGIYVTAFIIVGMLFVNPYQWKRTVLLVITLAFVVAGSHFFEKQNGITHLFKETVGIPLQQIAATVANEGVINEDQLAVIDSVLSVEFIKEKYNPYSADTLKWGGAPIDNNYLNNYKTDFLRTWLELFPNNKKIYIKAYLQNTYGFWSLHNLQRNTKYTTIFVPAFEEWIKENAISIKSIFPTNVQSQIEDALDKLLCSPGAGSWFWLALMLTLVLFRKYGWKIILVSMPLIGCWLTLMVSTPVAFQWRYLLCAPMTVPIFVGLIFRYSNLTKI